MQVFPQGLLPTKNYSSSVRTHSAVTRSNNFKAVTLITWLGCHVGDGVSEEPITTCYNMYESECLSNVGMFAPFHSITQKTQRLIDMCTEHGTCASFLLKFWSEYFPYDKYWTTYTRYAQRNVCTSSLTTAAVLVQFRPTFQFTDKLQYNSHVSYSIQCKFIQRHRVLPADRRTHKTGETNRCIFATIRWKRAKNSTSLNKCCATYVSAELGNSYALETHRP